MRSQRGSKSPGAWPREQLRLCGDFGVFEWFIPSEWGGQGWSQADLVRGYLALAEACLTTTFVITQLTGACQRIVGSQQFAELDGGQRKAELVSRLLAGNAFATLGISHLTTSRQHLKRPVLTATESEEGYLLSGCSPWVTGGRYADFLVLGASLLGPDGAADGRQMLAMIPRERAGVVVQPAAKLTALTASQTGAVEFDQVRLSPKSVLEGPVENVMQLGFGTRTGGLQTSTLALGLARAAVEFLLSESQRRPDLVSVAEQLDAEWRTSADLLLGLAAGTCDSARSTELRAKSNSLALRATQAALTAAKGAGFVEGHPVGRWCRQALFFLVWSCPQAVSAANLCEFAGIE